MLGYRDRLPGTPANEHPYFANAPLDEAVGAWSPSSGASGPR